MDNLFFELTIVLALAAIVSFIVHALKQPSVIGYIITGLLLGPLGLFHLRQDDALHALSQIGIALLLFLVGLELDMAGLKKLGRSALIAGILQIVLTGIAGLGLSLFLGFDILPSLYISLALTFSSTIIVVKLLSEKRDLQSLYGRIVVGILLTQDLVALLILVVLSSAGNSALSNLPLWQQAGFTIVKAVCVGLIIVLLSKKVFPRVLRFIGKSDELLLVFSLGWALGLATLVSLPIMGFSLEMGGFVAGLALAGTAMHHEISARVRSIRDFFIIIFFVVLGSSLSFAGLQTAIIPALALSIFVLLGNPFIVLVILGLLGYKPRTGFMASVTVGQVSEFGLILVALGVKVGHLDHSIVSLVTLVSLITVGFSSYLIMHAEKIYMTFVRPLSWFDFHKGSAETHVKEIKFENHVILIGVHRLGSNIAESLIKQKQDFVVVDFNPEVSERFAKRGVPAICGDMTDPYIQELAGLERAKLVISTLPQLSDTLAVVESVKKQKKKIRIIVTAQNDQDAITLYKNHIDYVLLPHFVGSLHLSKILEEKQTFSHLSQLRRHHLKVLSN